MKTGRIHWPSILQFSLSALAVFILWSGVLIFITVGLTGLIARSANGSVHDDLLQFFMVAAAYAFIGVLVLPSIYYALWRVLGLHVIDFRPFLVKLKPTLWIVVVPAVLLVGYWISGIPGLTWLVLPIMHLLAVGLPIAWILYLSVRNLPHGSPQRMWGVFTSGLLLAPLMALVLESLAGIVLVLFGVLYVSGHPGMVDKLSRFAEWMNLTNPTPELLLEKVSPLLVNPVVIFSVLFFGAVIVPLIEEALKPVGAWFLIEKKLSPAAGFMAGALSGSAYALFETLVLTSDGQQWVVMMVTRIGTSIIHIFTSGLVGWALVQVRYKHRYGLLCLSYLTAVMIHGLWNSLTLFSSFSILAVFYRLQLPYAFIYDIGWTAPLGLTFLAASAFVALLFANRTLRHSQDMQR